MSSGWDAWLRRVESYGFQSQYEKALDEKFYSLDQLEQLYVRPARGGKLLDPQFFEDLGIHQEEHRRLFSVRLCGSPWPPAPQSQQQPWQAEERRVDPEDGKAYTLQELTAKCEGEFTASEVEEYWESDCIPEKPEKPEKPETTVPTAPAAVAPAVLLPFLGRPCADWLREVGVNEARYRHVLESNFDSVEQIVEAYSTGPSGEPDVQAFLSDVGVEVEADRRAFEAWLLRRHAQERRGESCAEAAEAAGTVFAAWLAKVDTKGRLGRYAQILEDNYDEVQQIEELYVSSSGGVRTLDPQFFEDAGIQEESHRALFSSFYGGDARQAPAAEETSEAVSTSRRAFASWLRSMDASGGLDRYLQDLEDNYDSPMQVEELYLIGEDGNKSSKDSKRTLDPMFFEDMGIEDERHRQIFLRRFGAAEAAPSGDEATPAPPVVSAEPTFASWLKKVDESGRLLGYQAELRENYDNVEQVEELYVTKDGSKKKLSPQFFKDMGMEDKGHQALFVKFYNGDSAGEVNPSAPTAAAEMPKASPEAARAAENASPFKRWLLAVDAGGSLLCYLKDIEENYDAVDQIHELYVCTKDDATQFDAQFFQDMGIEDKSHQALFLKHYCAVLQIEEIYVITEGGKRKFDPRSFEDMPIQDKEHEAAAREETPVSHGESEFSRWLLAADASGRLLRYLKDIQENYDGVDQIEQLYVQTVDGKKKLDPEFFEDMGIQDLADQACFTRHCCGEPPAAPPSPVSNSKKAMEERHGDVEKTRGLDASPGGRKRKLDTPFAEEGGEEHGWRQAAVANGAGSEFASWLLKVDSSGGLLRYRPEIEDNYDAVDRIEDLYVTTEKGKKVFDVQFFEDVGIDDEAHKALFIAFYCGTASAAAVKDPEKRLVEEATHKDVPLPTSTSPFSSWLHAIDSSGGLLKYLEIIEDNYDGVEQIEDLYVSTDAGKKMFDELFFEDIGVQDASHQALFKRFYCGEPSTTPSQPPERMTPSEGLKEATKDDQQFSEDLNVEDAADQASPWVRWLLAVDSSGGLLRYKGVIEDNYDDLEQLEDLYVSGEGGKRKLDRLLFEDLEIEDPEHQALFSKYYSGDPAPARAQPPELVQPSESSKAPPNDSAFAKWLLAVDCSGRLLCYLKEMEENYDDVEQIESLYVSVEGGVKKLNSQFFEDNSIKDNLHQAFFIEFFGKETLPADVKATQDNRDSVDQIEDIYVPGEPGKRVFDKESFEDLSIEDAAHQAVGNGVPTPGSGSPFARWLLAIDSSGGLLCYQKVIEDNYDEVEQIEDLYVSTSGKGRELDPLFFKDAGIEDLAHQALFHVFYGASGPMEVEAVEKTEVEGAVEKGEMERWLLEVDDSGGLLRYRQELEGNYDSVDQIRDIYMQSKGGGGGSLKPNFFEDMGIEERKHVELFQSWAARLPAPAAAAKDAAASGVRAWLREIDPGGSLDSYCKLFEENYDNVEQITELYIIKKDGKRVFDPEMFEDMRIEDKGQQALIEAWFAKVIKALPPEAPQAVVGTKARPDAQQPNGGGRASLSPEHGLHSVRKESEDWYQRWQRRQHNTRPAAPSNHWKEDRSPIDPNQERWCSFDEAWYTFPSLKAKYAEECSEEDLEQFWRCECKPRWVVEQEEQYRIWEEAEKAKPLEQQEWYQKWLRRQGNRPKEAWSSGKDAEVDNAERRLDPRDGEWRTFQQTQEDSRPKEDQEWYQKWLRRQENRPNLSERWKLEEEAGPEGEFEGKKVEPDCGKVFTFDELRAEFGDQFSEADLRGYWRDAMTWAKN